MTNSSESLKTQCAELTMSAPTVTEWANPNNKYDQSRWLELSKAMPHDLRGVPYAASMFIGVRRGIPLVRLTASRPSDKGRETGFFEIALPKDEQEEAVILFCFPSQQEAVEHHDYLINPSMPLTHRSKHLKVRTLSKSHDSTAKQRRGAQAKAASWLNAIVEILIPEGWDSSTTYELFEQLLGLEPEKAAEVLENIKRLRVVDNGETFTFFDPALVAGAHV